MSPADRQSAAEYLQGRSLAAALALWRSDRLAPGADRPRLARVGKAIRWLSAEIEEAAEVGPAPARRRPRPKVKPSLTRGPESRDMSPSPAIQGRVCEPTGETDAPTVT